MYYPLISVGYYSYVLLAHLLSLLNRLPLCFVTHFLCAPPLGRKSSINLTSNYFQIYFYLIKINILPVLYKYSEENLFLSDVYGLSLNIHIYTSIFPCWLKRTESSIHVKNYRWYIAHIDVQQIIRFDTFSSHINQREAHNTSLNSSNPSYCNPSLYNLCKHFFFYNFSDFR